MYLDGVRGDDGEACLAAGHDARYVAGDGEVGGDTLGGHLEHDRGLAGRHLHHARDHQRQRLRAGDHGNAVVAHRQCARRHGAGALACLDDFHERHAAVNVGDATFDQMVQLRLCGVGVPRVVNKHQVPEVVGDQRRRAQACVVLACHLGQIPAHVLRDTLSGISVLGLGRRVLVHDGLLLAVGSHHVVAHDRDRTRCFFERRELVHRRLRLGRLGEQLIFPVHVPHAVRRGATHHGATHHGPCHAHPTRIPHGGGGHLASASAVRGVRGRSCGSGFLVRVQGCRTSRCACGRAGVRACGLAQQQGAGCGVRGHKTRN